MGLPLANKRHYTYADYLTWPDDVRCELIGGQPVMMSPPTIPHQIITGQVYAQLTVQLKDHPCLPLIAPVGVRLPKPNQSDEFVDNVVEPDVLIVCDPGQLTVRGVRGAPDWILEVISPSNAAHDIVTKRRLYEQAGVREFWLLHPVDRVLTVHVLGADGLYGRSDVQTLDGQTELTVLPGTRIDWDALRWPALAADLPAPTPERKV